MELVGTSIRSIRIVESLGAGGMGEVYLGVDERLQRKVAIKAIRGDRRLDAQTKARFLREARVLSQLDHPNICRLYDYIEGEENDFIILELVQGRTLRQVLQQPLGFADQLTIAMQIAGALVAAHKMGVVHRDLKPENVMLTEDGQIKVLDFGLARPVAINEFEGETSPPPSGSAPTAAIDSGITQTGAVGSDVPSNSTPGRVTVTQLGAILGTPQYMSPEQARGEMLTAASDLYSLGLILQELFTGRAALPMASDRVELVQKSMWGESEKAQGIDPDLAALVEKLKALAPQDRPSAEATTERLRWIAAKPARWRRTIVRAAMLSALMIAAVVSTVGFVLAKRAQKSAEQSEQRARQAKEETEAVNDFLRNMLSSADPSRAGIDIKVSDVLDRAAESADADFAERPGSRAAVLETLGRTYHALGLLPKGHDMLSRAVALRNQTLGPRAPETLSAMHNLGVLLTSMGRYDQADSVLHETLDLRAAVLGPEHRNTLLTQGALAYNYHSQYRLELAEPLFRKGYQTCLRVFGEKDLSTITAMRNLGQVLRDMKELDEAETLIQGAFENAKTYLGADHLLTLDCQTTFAKLRFRQKRFAEAITLYRQLIPIMKQVRGEEHPTTLLLVEGLARCLAEVGEYAESEKLARELIARQSKVIGPASRDTLETMRTLAYCFYKQKMTKESDAIFVERWQIARKHLGDENPLTLETKSVVANCLVDNGQAKQAEPMFREVLAARLRILGDGSAATRGSKKDLAKTLRLLGRKAEAEKLEAELGIKAPSPASS